MLKYCEVQGKRKSKIIKRSELGQNQKYSPCIISYPYTQENKERCIEWVTSTINEIESMDVFDYWETRDFRGFNSFTCQWTRRCLPYLDHCDYAAMNIGVLMSF